MTGVIPFSIIPFAGDEYDPADYQRLETQIGRVFAVMSDGQYRTVQLLCWELTQRFPGSHFPQNSIQAQLRNLRKIGRTVEKRYVGIGLWEYRLVPGEAN